MPCARAISAAVIGAISPRLLMPSVSRMMTFDLASLSRRRLIAVASPLPMAVPSSIRPLRMRASSVCRVLWSVVSGLCVKASPAKTTSPSRSPTRSLMNDAATSLAAVMRSGLKSRASIEPETSIESMMSMPSVEVRTFCSMPCGRASATTSSA